MLIYVDEIDKRKNCDFIFRSNDVTIESEDRRRVTEKGVFFSEQKSALRMIRLMNGQRQLYGKTTKPVLNQYQYCGN